MKYFSTYIKRLLQHIDPITGSFRIFEDVLQQKLVLHDSLDWNLKKNFDFCKFRKKKITWLNQQIRECNFVTQFGFCLGEELKFLNFLFYSINTKGTMCYNCAFGWNFPRFILKLIKSVSWIYDANLNELSFSLEKLQNFHHFNT